jgi:hypothetical protein
MRSALFWLLLLAAGTLLFAGLRTSADDSPNEKSAKELAQEFVYPKAKKFGEDREGARMYHARLTTEDDVDKVTAWYEKALGTPGDEGIEFNPGQQAGVRLSAINDSRQPGKTERAAGDPRPLTLQVYVKKTNSVVVVAVVSRGKDEKLSHIALTFLDNKSQ